MFWFKRQVWVHVKEFRIKFQHLIFNSGYIYIHLYESSTGNRKIEFGSTVSDLPAREVKKAAMKSEIYHERVARWLGGRHDIEIPGYNNCSQDDMANVLKNVVK